jgi:hypothetical protein
MAYSSMNQAAKAKAETILILFNIYNPQHCCELHITNLKAASLPLACKMSVIPCLTNPG